MKDESRRTRLENEARVFARKLALVQETRTEKREIERILVDQRLLDRRAALERKAEVRASLAQCGSARAQEAERKRALATETYAARVEAEVRAREATEARLAAMARKELDLIDRLRDREAEQQKVRVCRTLALRACQRVVACGCVCTKQVGEFPQKQWWSGCWLQAYAQLQAALNLGREVSPCTAYVCGDGAEGALSEWRVRDAFHSHAGDDGALATERVGSALRRLGIELDKAQVDAAVRQLDPDGSGVVHLGEFVTWVRG